jgi:ABC-2 type transport system ATP-binding protein
MHQKAQLIATILNDPDLLIVDEPFQGLDPVNAEMLKGVVREQRDRGAAVVMSTHDMSDAQTQCDRILLIDKGRRLLYGTVRAVRDAFSDGAVEVHGQAIPTDVTTLRSVTEARATDGTVRYLLAVGATPRDLFHELATTAAEVERFAVEAPDLDEIFIRTVAGDPRAEAVR